MADPKKMDAFAYSIVNRDQVHVLQWNSTGIHSLKMSRAAFAALPQRPFFLYRGRSTPGQQHSMGHETCAWLVRHMARHWCSIWVCAACLFNCRECVRPGEQPRQSAEGS